MKTLPYTATILSVKHEIVWRKEQLDFLKTTLTIGDVEDNAKLYLEVSNEVDFLTEELRILLKEEDTRELVKKINVKRGHILRLECEMLNGKKTLEEISFIELAIKELEEDVDFLRAELGVVTW